MPDEDDNNDVQTGNSTETMEAAPEDVTNDATEAAALPAEGSEEEVIASKPEFTPLVENRKGSGAAASLDRFRDVRVDVWAELGRVQIPIGELLHIGEGSVLRLDRPIGEPVDLVSQGVRLARGEIVVVDDCFAIRIKEIETPAE